MKPENLTSISRFLYLKPSCTGTSVQDRVGGDTETRSHRNNQFTSTFLPWPLFYCGSYHFSPNPSSMNLGEGRERELLANPTVSCVIVSGQPQFTSLHKKSVETCDIQVLVPRLSQPEETPEKHTERLPAGERHRSAPERRHVRVRTPERHTGREENN